MMRLRELIIRRKEKWEDKEEKLAGIVRFVDDASNEVKVILNERVSVRVLDLCAREIAEAGLDLAASLQRQAEE